MSLINLSKRERRLAFFTVAVVLASLIYSFLLKPLFYKWGRLNQEIFSKEIELKKNIRYLRQKNKVNNIYQEYVKYVQRAGTDEEEMTFLLNEVEKTARNAGMRIVNIRPKPTKDLEFCKKYILEMHCEAALDECLNFIYNLQESEQLIRVERLKLTSPSKAVPALKAHLFVTRILTHD